MGYLFDFVSVVILFGCAIIGIKRGFVREVFDLISVGLAIVFVGLCEYFGFRVFDIFLGNELLGHLLVLIVEFFGAIILIRFAAFLIQRAARIGPLAIFEHLGGGVVAVIKAYIAIGFVLVLLVRYPVLGTAWIQQSILAPLFLFAGKAVIYLLPKDFAQAIKQFVNNT